MKLKDQYVFFEDDDITCMYFHKNGDAGFVLPRHYNLMYVKLNKGLHFGISCIVGSFMDKREFDIDNWISYRDSLRR